MELEGEMRGMAEPPDPAFLREYSAGIEDVRGKQILLQARLEAIKRKIETAKKAEEAIIAIPVLFDNPDFTTIANHLGRLRIGGITGIKIGSRTYTVEELCGIVEWVGSYARSITQSGGRPSEEEIDQALADKGVTTGKISAYSALGFRQCMMEIVKFALKRNTRAVSV